MENQRTFVSNRVIQENMLIAQKVFDFLKRNQKVFFVVVVVVVIVKTDMAKGYDRVE